jgi:hypothetical protein
MKNKHILLMVVGLFTMINLQAEKIDGIVIFKNDSIAHVTFIIPKILLLDEINYQSIQEGVTYLDPDNKKIKLKPEQVKEIKFKYLGEEIRMISCDHNPYRTSKKGILLKLIMNGRLKLFTFFTSRGPVGMYVGPGSKWVGVTGDIELIVLQKGEEELFKPRFVSSNFKEDMKVYLSDCPSLIEKIEKETYTIDAMREIVLDYNTNCQVKK